MIFSPSSKRNFSEAGSSIVDDSMRDSCPADRFDFKKNLYISRILDILGVGVGDDALAAFFEGRT